MHLTLDVNGRRSDGRVTRTGFNAAHSNELRDARPNIIYSAAYDRDDYVTETPMPQETVINVGTKTGSTKLLTISSVRM